MKKKITKHFPSSTARIEPKASPDSGRRKTKTNKQKPIYTNPNVKFDQYFKLKMLTLCCLK